MSIEFRVDDFPGTKPEEFWRHNLQNFREFHGVMRGCGVPSYTLGIIPLYADEEVLSALSELEGVVPAVHGLTHDESRVDDLEYMSFGEQVLALSRTKKRFEAAFETTVDTYIPPHNYVSRTSVLALESLGFKRVMVGPGVDRRVVEEMRDRMEFACSVQGKEYGRSDEMLAEESVKWVVGHSHVDVPITFHWTWEWNIGLDSLREYLGKLDEAFSGHGGLEGACRE